MRLRIAPSLLASAAILVSATGAHAEGDGPFGAHRQLMISADRLMPVFGYTAQTVTANDGDTKTVTTDSGVSAAFLVGREPTLGLIHTIPRVAVDYTPIPRLTIGTAFVVAFGIGGTHLEERTPKNEPATKHETSNPGSTILGFAPRVGYIFPVGKKLAFWPRGGLAFYSVSSKRAAESELGVTSTATVTDTTFSLDLDPQLVWTPIPNVLVLVGPVANLPLSGSHDTAFAQGSIDKDRSDDLTVFHLGLEAGLGFWFDL
jgi:hypothetical protein